MIKCSLCRKRFGSEAALKQHARDYHKRRASEVVAVEVDDDGYTSEADYEIERQFEQFEKEYWK